MKYLPIVRKRELGKAMETPDLAPIMNEIEKQVAVTIHYLRIVIRISFTITHQLLDDGEHLARRHYGRDGKLFLSLIHI